MRDNVSSLLIYFSLICVFISDLNGQDNGDEKFVPEGSVCHQLGFTGICQKIKKCPIALDALKKLGRHDLKRCGFAGSHEIVCCPDLDANIDRRRLEETTTLSKGVIWSGHVGSTGHGGNDHKIVKIKRKSQKMCEKMYTENRIKPDIGPQILRGQNSTMGQFPHMVALAFLNTDNETEWRCGGSLISPRFLLTAAHCIQCLGCIGPIKARLGIVDIDDTKSAQDIDIIDATPHPDYNITSKHNDIGIIKLARDVEISKLVYPACLYTDLNDPKDLQIVGWGQTESDDINSKAKLLQYAVIQPVPVSQCNDTVVSKNKYSLKVILDTQICGTTDSDACPGDSGGPLQIRQSEGGYAVVGVVSYGVLCGTRIPGIYTRVAKYLDWIEETVWPDHPN